MGISTLFCPEENIFIKKKKKTMKKSQLNRNLKYSSWVDQQKQFVPSNSFVDYHTSVWPGLVHLKSNSLY